MLYIYLVLSEQLFNNQLIDSLFPFYSRSLSNNKFKFFPTESFGNTAQLLYL